MAIRMYLTTTWPVSPVRRLATPSCSAPWSPEPRISPSWLIQNSRPAMRMNTADETTATSTSPRPRNRPTTASSASCPMIANGVIWCSGAAAMSTSAAQK